MTPAAMMLDRLAGRGVTFRLDGDALVPRGPREVLTTDVLDELRRHKVALVAELRRGAADDLAQRIDELREAYAERVAIVLEAGDIAEVEARRIAEAEIGARFAVAFCTTSQEDAGMRNAA